MGGVLVILVLLRVKKQAIFKQRHVKLAIGTCANAKIKKQKTEIAYLPKQNCQLSHIQTDNMPSVNTPFYRKWAELSIPLKLCLLWLTIAPG